MLTSISFKAKPPTAQTETPLEQSSFSVWFPPLSLSQGLLTPRWLWLQRSWQRGAGFRAAHWQWPAGTAGWALGTWPRWNGWRPTGPGPAGKETLQQNKTPQLLQSKLYELKITAASIHYLKSFHPNRKTLKCDTQDKCAGIERIFVHRQNPVCFLSYFKE